MPDGSPRHLRLPASEATDSIGGTLRLLSEAWNNVFHAEIDRYGITRGQWRFLRELWHEDGLTQTELAARVGRREPTAGTAVRVLLRRGLIRIERQDHDRRKTRVYLTRKGRDLAKLVEGRVIPPSNQAALLQGQRRILHQGFLDRGSNLGAKLQRRFQLDEQLRRPGGEPGLDLRQDRQGLRQGDQIPGRGPTGADPSGQAFQVGYLFHAMLAATAGPEIYNRLYGPEPDISVLETPEFAKAVEIIRVFSEQATPESENRPWNETTNTVIAGQALFHIMGDWMKGEWLAAGKVPGVDFGCAVIPGTKAVAAYNWRYTWALRNTI